MKRRIICWFKGHDPLIEQNMMVTIPARQIDCANGMVIQCMGRTFAVGNTICKRCSRNLYIEGSVIRLRGPDPEGR
jgi:hypothetical protein